jgi:hypothetical protein
MKNRGPSSVILSCVVFLFFISCTISSKQAVVVSETDVAVAWADMALYVTRNTPANSPTYASRALGYIGVTMYESVVRHHPEYRSLAGQLNGLDSLPMPIDDLPYNEILSLNAAHALILKKIYHQTSNENKHRIDSLENFFYQYFSTKLQDEQTASRSVALGRSIAEAIFEWSKTDGGHRGYLTNFDKKNLRESAPGCWEPPLYGQSWSHYPLHPYWGTNRTFVKTNSEMSIPAILKYDTTAGSVYVQQFAEVFEKSKNLSLDEKEAALWWGDDPGDTFTPPGHSYYLATLVVKKSKPSLIKCCETYARVGIAVADAFINCWKWKYHYYSERPSTFITKQIDQTWESFWPDPPFPAFPSGHATQAAATAAVLTDLYGEKFSVTDDAHAGRARDDLRNVDFKPRHFDSFWEIAIETANSRFYGGIHTRQDNDTGLREGKTMGKNVNALRWRNEGAYASH